MTDAVEATTAVLEEVPEVAERIVKAHLNGTTKVQQILILSSVALTGAAIGGAVSYFLTKKAGDKRYAETVTTEVAKAKEFYARANKVSIDGTPLSPEEMFEQYKKPEVSEYDTRSNHIITEAPVATENELISDEEWLKGSVEAPPLPDGPVITRDGLANQPATEEEFQNIWEGHVEVPDDWDNEAEQARRDASKPYILSHDEYFEADPGFEQDELTWFEGGRTAVLADSQGIPVEDVEGTVGEANLDKFGHGSKNANTLYIRNEVKQLDFEVTKSNGSYAQEVLGIDDTEEGGELRHSMRRPRKMRASDE